QASTHDVEGLSLNLWNRKNEDLHFISASGRSRLVDRSPKHIQRQELGTTTIALIVKGEAFFHNKTGTHILRPGDVLMYDLDSPFILGSSQTMSELMLEIPTILFEKLFGRHRKSAEVIRTRKIDAQHPYKIALAKIIQRSLMTQDHSVTTTDDVLELLQRIGGKSSSLSSQSY